MNYQAHRVGGICAGIVTSALTLKGLGTNVEVFVATAITIGGGAIGGLLPDIDLPTSKVGRKVPHLSKIINKLFGHRGFTHTLLGFVLFSFLMMFLGSWFPAGIRAFTLQFAIGLSVGYLSHLILDMTTKSGIPLLYPLTPQIFRVAKLRSGKDDLLVSIIVVLSTAAYLYYFGIL